MESKAPNLSSLYLRGLRLNFSCVETLQMKKLDLSRSDFIRDASSKLPSIMPNLETLAIASEHEEAFPIGMTISLVSFLEASPSLETLTLDVTALRMVHERIDFSGFKTEAHA